MTPTVLSDEERRKFIQWLEADIESGKAIWKQLDKIKAPSVLRGRIEAETGAEIIVLAKLTSIETLTIKG